MERSFAALAGFEHEAELITGLDDLITCHEEEKEKTPEAIYTETVLKLDGGTYDIIDGQEGFLDNIKRGASKVYEWIKSMIRAIRNWFSGNGKREYNNARLDIKQFKAVEDLDKALDKILEPYILAYPPFPGLTTSGMDPETKKIVQENITEQAQELKTDVEKKEKIIGTIVNEISNKILVRSKQVGTRIAEIKRIDPTGETLETLGLSRAWKFITDANQTNETSLGKDDQASFSHTVKAIVDDAEVIQGDLAKAVNGLDKMNEAARSDDTETRRLSRAGSVVKELSEIAALYRDMVITISSQVQMGLKKAETSIVKSALSDALKHSDGNANKYIQQAIDSL